MSLALRTVKQVLPSLYFSPAGHRHVRPVSMYHEGSVLRCPFCEMDPPPPPWKDPVEDAK